MSPETFEVERLYSKPLRDSEIRPYPEPPATFPGARLYPGAPHGDGNGALRPSPGHGKADPARL